MRTTGKNGFLFSLDLSIGLLAMLLMMAMLLLHFNAVSERQVDAVSRFELQRKAVFIADALLKNSNAEQPMLGSAIFDAKRHRVLGNELAIGMLQKAEQIDDGSVFVKRLSFTTKAGEQEIFGEGRGTEECASVERMGLVAGQRARVSVVVCRK